MNSNNLRAWNLSLILMITETLNSFVIITQDELVIYSDLTMSSTLPPTTAPMVDYRMKATTGWE